MSLLSIRLLGNFQIVYGDTPITAIQQLRQQSLLAYLLVHRHAPQSRQHLAFLFWPDSSETQARANLRQTLHHLRQALPDHYLHFDAQQVQWLPSAPCTVDLVELEEQLRQAKKAPPQQQTEKAHTALQRAIDLYQGDLLPGCYDDWIIPERERWREHFINALDQLILLAEANRDYAAAITYAQRLLRHDPLHETTYRRLMQLYAWQGERASALRTYHTCVTVLQRELGVEPHPTTQESYARLLNLTITPETTVRSSLGTLPLVGRQAEWGKLQAAWRRAAAGAPQVVLVAGEAGIGKTRLVEELLHWSEPQGIRAARTRSYAAEGALAYSPVIEWLRSEAIQASLTKLDPLWLSEIARLLPELLSQQPHLAPPPPLQEHWQRRRFFEALARACLHTGQPLLLVHDDLQWCDGETLEWLHFLLRFDPHARLLLVGTARPEAVDEQHPLTALLLDLRSAGQLSEFELTPLSRSETEQLATQIAQQSIKAEDSQALYQATQGNPLFVAEMVRAGMNGGDEETRRPEDKKMGRQGGATLPPKVQAVIGTRLRQLSPAARTLASLAAVIGQAFTFELLARASGSEEETLLRSFDELWKRRIIREQRANAYDFSHDRLREAAYGEGSPAQRMVQHRRVAQALEQIYAADLDAVSAQVAVHYERVGMAEQAIPYYQRAAEAEEKVFSYTTALAYLDAGLRLIRQQSRTAENRKQEVILLSAKAQHLSVIRGFTVAEIAEICRQLALLLPDLDDDQFAFQAHLRLRGFYGASGAMALAYDHTNHVLALAARLTDPVYQLGAWQGAGVVNLQLGHFAIARRYMEQGAVLYRQSALNINPRLLENGSANGMLSNLILTLWLLGYPDQARAQIPEAVAIAERSGNPLRLSIPPFFASIIYRYMGDVDATAVAGGKQLALDAQYGVPLAGAEGLNIHGWVWAQQGRFSEGIAQMRAGIDALTAMNHTMFQTHRLAWLAEAQMLAGDWATAAATLDEAFAMSDKSGQRSCDAELYRLRGEWWVQSAAQPSDATAERAAEVAFEQAIELARTQEAKSFELRAVMSLCRLWQRQGKQAEARARLAEIYGWFTEGFDTADLQAAKDLLAELT